MKVKLKPSSIRIAPTGDKAKLDEAQSIAHHIDRKAVLGVPYSMVTIFDEVQDMQEELEPLSEVGQVMYELVNRHGWKTYSHWGYMMKGSGNVQLGNLLSHGLPRGIQYNLSDIAQFILLATGETIKADTIRKTMGRLVDQDRFKRIDQGVFEKTHKGF